MSTMKNCSPASEMSWLSFYRRQCMWICILKRKIIMHQSVGFWASFKLSATVSLHTDWTIAAS